MTDSRVFFISVLLTVTLLLTQFAAADYTLTNNHPTEPVWAIYSTWNPADRDWKAGFRTRGWYRIKPGTTIQFPVPVENMWVYIRVERPNGEEIKPPDHATKNWSQFWKHPFKVFTAIETGSGDILQSNVNIQELEQGRLYAYRNGGKYTISGPQTGIVRILHFLPKGVSPEKDIETELQALGKATQAFFATELERHGFGRKTFTFETYLNGDPLVHWIEGRFTEDYYHTYTAEKILTEIEAAFDIKHNVHLIFMSAKSEKLDNAEICGMAWNPLFEEKVPPTAQGNYGFAVVPASGDCLEAGKAIPLIAHELGHAFGLEHDFRSEDYIMSFADTPQQLSHCGAEWLNASLFFNPGSSATHHLTTFQKPTLFEVSPDTVNVSFALKDLNGLHQAQLIVPTTDTDPNEGFKLHSCKSLKGAVSTNVEFVIQGLTPLWGEEVMLSVIDRLGNTQRFVYTFTVDDIEPAFPNPPGAAPVLSTAAPTETTLFPNYPNPFNPETWIPYQLAHAASVTVTIYDISGAVVRQLMLGHQPAGVYQRRSRAGHWDGRNTLGEKVATGLYFYTLTAGTFTATRQLLIRK